MTNNDSSKTVTPLKKHKIRQLGHHVQKRVINLFKSHIIPRSQRFYHFLLEQYHNLDTKNEPRQRRFVIATILFFIVWLLLVATFNFSEILVGFFVALLTAWLSDKHLSFIDNIKLNIATPWHILRYLRVFSIALLHANIDMARRVLSPKLPINPALVEVQTRLKSPLGKLILANSITLTPGTLTVDVIGDHLQVHWVDSTPGTDLEHATHAIAESFERHLQEFLE